MTLVEFLTARIVEDEKIARRLVPGRVAPANGTWAEDSLLLRGIAGLERRHIARWDPARVLAECQAKRLIMEHAALWAETLTQTPDGWSESGATGYRMAMEWTLQQMALPVADHPDYDESWRP